MAVKKSSDAERFGRSYIVRESGCWEWLLCLDPDGYGFFKIGSHTDRTRKQVRAHRWSYEHFVGPIPRGLQIDHLCRNRACVNWQHLEPVTGAINTKRGSRANQTHCKRGHLLCGDNVRLNSSGGRICKTCSNEYQRVYNRNNQWAYSKAFRLRRKLKAGV